MWIKKKYVGHVTRQSAFFVGLQPPHQKQNFKAQLQEENNKAGPARINHSGAKLIGCIVPMTRFRGAETRYPPRTGFCRYVRNSFSALSGTRSYPELFFPILSFMEDFFFFFFARRSYFFGVIVVLDDEWRNSKSVKNNLFDSGRRKMIIFYIHSQI